MRAIRIISVRGIELRAHWSLGIIVALVMTSIALGEVPSEYPRWSEVAAWSAGFGVALGLVASIALHELAHSLVAQHVGVRVPQVTLFVFGGIAQLSERPRRASHEFAITAAGPLTSFALGIALLGAASIAAIEPRATVASVAALVALVLGQVNIALAVFNCLPGAPLDGGRILHSIVWLVTGSEARATKLASWSGQAIGTGLATLGFLMVLGRNVPWFGSGAGGLWLILIGWFIAGLARAERVSTTIDQVASLAPITRITRTLPAAQADTPLDEFADGVLLPRGAHALPVVENDDHVIGIASIHDALTVDEAQRSGVPVRSVMTPWEQVHTIDAESSIGDALRAFSEHDVHQLPVLDDGRIIGFVHRDDALSWLQLHASS